jgi:hypothetical protein
MILLDVLLIIMLIFLRDEITKPISAEGYKLLWQLAIITVGGGFISLAFAELKREQESRKATRDYFKNVFSRALKEYNKAKKMSKAAQGKCNL